MLQASLTPGTPLILVQQPGQSGNGDSQKFITIRRPYWITVGTRLRGEGFKKYSTQSAAAADEAAQELAIGQTVTVLLSSRVYQQTSAV